MNLRTTVYLLPWSCVHCLSYPCHGYGQDSSGRKISLDEAIDLSIKNSKPLRAAQARIEQASANTTISKQNQLPDLKVSGSYLRLTQPNIDMQYKSVTAVANPASPSK